MGSGPSRRTFHHQKTEVTESLKRRFGVIETAIA